MVKQRFVRAMLLDDMDVLLVMAFGRSLTDKVEVTIRNKKVTRLSIRGKDNPIELDRLIQGMPKDMVYRYIWRFITDLYSAVEEGTI
jgi:hypothetical protein